ncbi:DUF1223 domain-containing protein [Opitutus terrae]|uniref:Uncharacterized protein n=1 Tax=Opitutus terrae (strain DSM 11246 / JCM 15787 / PB90-1) TaxID=452637 RepID=B1ZQB2_OPITP|nr:DUF1223 domain-containing protein [Opitutus terrae]ACB73592.1 protein of unknown function DUF1223 [Opitutus terrae PB90-1]
MATSARHIRRALIAIVLEVSLGCAGFAQSSAIEIRSPAHHVTLLELYTSEGCSSCPPAEAWVGGLRNDAGLWTEFVPLAFHVDYWDHLGWQDPWAERSYADRQRRYAAEWGSGTIYTPGFVLDGREWRDWRSQRTALKAVAAKAGVLTASSTDGRQWAITFDAADAPDRADVHAALLWSGVHSDVKAGENRGRHLSHDFVVAALTRAPLTRRGDALHGEVALRPDRKPPAEARLALAVWVTRPGELSPLQAAGGWLPGAAD